MSFIADIHVGPLKPRLKRAASLALTLLLALALMPGRAWAADYRNAYEQTGAMLAGYENPTVSSTGGEWAVIGLCRGDHPLRETYLATYYGNVVRAVRATGPRLDGNKSTENARVILALLAAGYDPRNVEGADLVSALDTMDYITYQGINGPIWALIALDAGDFEAPGISAGTDGATRARLLDYILNAQREGGNWSLSETFSIDPDTTAMALQALAPYYDPDSSAWNRVETNAEALKPRVRSAVDAGLGWLSRRQNNQTAGFASWGAINSESCAQVIVALTALGINPLADERFAKNGRSVLDALLDFAVEGGGFAHQRGGGLNGMSSEQAFYALVAYERFKAGKTSLYDMSDVVEQSAPAIPAEPDPQPQPHPDPQPDPTPAPDPQPESVSQSRANQNDNANGARQNGANSNDVTTGAGASRNAGASRSFANSSQTPTATDAAPTATAASSLQPLPRENDAGGDGGAPSTEAPLIWPWILCAVAGAAILGIGGFLLLRAKPAKAGEIVEPSDGEDGEDGADGADGATSTAEFPTESGAEDGIDKIEATKAEPAAPPEKGEIP